MPRWKYATKEGDVEDSVEMPVTTECPSFDGFWEATMVDGGSTSSTIVILSGRNVWHDGSQFASIKVLNAQTCALIMDDDDVRGYLSTDGEEIEWEDGDLWKRAKRHIEQVEAQPGLVTSERVAQRNELPNESSFAKDPEDFPEAALEALLQRNAVSLQRILDSGFPVETSISSMPIWRHLGWMPEGDCRETPVSLLVGAILLQWPEGVRICVEKNANVNATYAGPFQGSDGRTVWEKSGAPILRVALSARGPAQCIICQHILAAKVRGRTFQSVRRKAKDEMDFVTRGLFENFQGPFADS